MCMVWQVPQVTPTPDGHQPRPGHLARLARPPFLAQSLVQRGGSRDVRPPPPPPPPRREADDGQRPPPPPPPPRPPTTLMGSVQQHEQTLLSTLSKRPPPPPPPLPPPLPPRRDKSASKKRVEASRELEESRTTSSSVPPPPPPPPRQATSNTKESSPPPPLPWKKDESPPWKKEEPRGLSIWNHGPSLDCLSPPRAKSAATPPFPPPPLMPTTQQLTSSPPPPPPLPPPILVPLAVDHGINDTALSVEDPMVLIRSLLLALLQSIVLLQSITHHESRRARRHAAAERAKARQADQQWIAALLGRGQQPASDRAWNVWQSLDESVLHEQEYLHETFLWSLPRPSYALARPWAPLSTGAPLSQAALEWICDTMAESSPSSILTAPVPTRRAAPKHWPRERRLRRVVKTREVLPVGDEFVAALYNLEESTEEGEFDSILDTLSNPRVEVEEYTDYEEYEADLSSWEDDDNEEAEREGLAVVELGVAEYSPPRRHLEALRPASRDFPHHRAFSLVDLNFPEYQGDSRLDVAVVYVDDDEEELDEDDLELLCQSEEPPHLELTVDWLDSSESEALDEEDVLLLQESNMIDGQSDESSAESLPLAAAAAMKGTSLRPPPPPPPPPPLRRSEYSSEAEGVDQSDAAVEHATNELYPTRVDYHWKLQDDDYEPPPIPEATTQEIVPEPDWRLFGTSRVKSLWSTLFSRTRDESLDHQDVVTEEEEQLYPTRVDYHWEANDKPSTSAALLPPRRSLRKRLLDLFRTDNDLEPVVDPDDQETANDLVALENDWDDMSLGESAMQGRPALDPRPPPPLPRPMSSSY